MATHFGKPIRHLIIWRLLDQTPRLVALSTYS
jgi:hypothetical protein